MARAVAHAGHRQAATFRIQVDLTATLCIDNLIPIARPGARPSGGTPVMTHQPRYHGRDEDSSAGVGREPLPGGQRWTRVALIAIVAALLLVILILHITGTLGPDMNG